jgi:tubulin beta
MGTNFWEVVCDQHGIGGDGEYYGGNDAQLPHQRALYHEA